MFLVHVRTPTRLTSDEERLFGELSEIEREKAEKNGTGGVAGNGAGKKGILGKLSSLWG